MSNLQYRDSTAWMIRRDGRVFPVVQHIYGNPLETEETLFAAEWLCGHTALEKTQRDIAVFVSVWASQFADKKDSEELRRTIYQEIEKRPYRFITRKFVDKIVDWVREGSSMDETTNIEECCKSVVLDLNEEFIRVRFGGMYHTNPASRELYFRISSENYNWSQVIMEFIRKSRLDYSEFFVVVDEEAAETNPNILKQSMLLRME